MASSSDLDRLIEMLKRCEVPQESQVKALCAQARLILVDESNVQRVDAPVVVSDLGPFGVVVQLCRLQCLTIPSNPFLSPP